ncbi:hypothetical protein DICPUDRAFT_159937 [Dictyostelium purpureum]|uniref:Uncharacterized protein n=1 Tax=Dictyostelium purpureum TaxID=5786 RepID=F1A5B6_DICPU|nr:uncharacterized protein DICPUDRAFT_159937 [Dictyostelium purpureum]EGC28612.1 hypothetical protein DICPUDRAFT_159937 [Dictyostelium purpureum]|eukprot:XP_003294860.1 hypothetical protein DICPUDRAFT_159937 [Dictyostelium purpureum]
MPFNTPTGSAVVDIMNERILINYIKICHKVAETQILSKSFNLETITAAGAAAGCADTGGSTAGGESGTGGTGGTGGTSTSGSTGIIAGNSSDASEDSSKGSSSDSRSSSAKLAQEDLQSENHNIKSEIIILQDKFSKESFNIGHDTLVGISEVSPSSHTDRGDRSINIGFSKKLIKSMKSNVEEINGDRIKEIEHESESYRIAKKNLAMEKDLETKQFIESQRNSNQYQDSNAKLTDRIKRSNEPGGNDQ